MLAPFDEYICYATVWKPDGENEEKTALRMRGTITTLINV